MAEPLKKDEDENVTDKTSSLALLPDPVETLSIATPGKAAARSGVFDIDPVVGQTGGPGMVAGEKDTFGGALTPEGTLGPTMQSSVEAQQRSLNLDEFKSMLQRGQISSVTGRDTAALLNFVNQTNNPELDDASRKYFDDKLLDALDLYTYQQSKEPSQAVIPYERDGQFVPTEEAYESPNLMSAQETLYAAKSEIRDGIKGKFQNVPLNDDLLPDDIKLLEQIIIDRTSTGSFFNVIEEKLYRNVAVDGAGFFGDAIFSWIPSAVVGGLAYAGENTLGNLFQAGVNATLGTQYETRYVGMREMWRNAKPYRDAVERTWAATLSDDLGLETTQQTVQEILREELNSRLADDPERLNRILNVNVQNTDGTTASIPRPLINESVASDIVSASVQTLTQKERFGVNAVDTALILFGSGKARKAADAEYVAGLRRKVDEYIAIDDDFGKRLSGMNFGEQILTLESTNKIKKFNRTKVQRTLAFEAAEDGAERLSDDLVRLENDLVVRQTMDGKTVATDRLGSYKKGQKYSFAGDTTIPELMADIDTVKRRRITAKLSLHGSPILRSSLVDGLPLAAAQYAGGYFGADMLGGDVFAAEGIAALLYIGPGRLALKGIGYGLARADAATGNMAAQGGMFLETALNLASIPAAKLFDMDIKDPFTGIMTDRDLAQYRKIIETEKGRSLTYAEQRALKYMRMVSNSLDDDSRAMVKDSVDAYRDLQLKIVAAFPKDQQAEVTKAFSETFAEMSDLGWMRSAAALSLGSVSALALQGQKGVEEASNLSFLQKDKLRAADKSIKRLRQMIKDNKNIDPESGQVLEDYMKVLEATRTKLSDDFDTQMADLDRTIENLLTTALSDPNQDVKSTTISALISLGVDAKKFIEPELDIVAAQQALHTTARASLQERAQILKDTRFVRTADVQARGRDSERVLMSFTAEAQDAAQAPYKALDKKALESGVTINVSGMIRDLLSFTRDPRTGDILDDDAAAGSFRTFFSKESEFFQGQLGQKVFKVFEGMAERSIKGTLEPETYQAFMNNEIIEMSRKAGLDIEKGELLEASHLDVALHLMDKGDFRGFQAAPGEVMEVYAAFRNYAVAQNDAGLSRQYKIYATSVRELVKNKAGDYYDEWQAAADNYKVQWFDRFQRMQGPATKTLKSQKFGQLGPRVQEGGEDVAEVVEEVTDVGDETVFARLLQYGYGTVDPGTMLLPMIGQIERAAKGDGKDLAKLNSLATRLFGEFADKDMQGNLFFDFSNPKSVERYELLQSTLNEYVFDGWARNVTNQLDNAAKRTRRTPGVAQDIRDTGGLNVKLPQLSNIDDVQQAFNIRIINGPNNTAQGMDGAVVYNMLDLEGMIDESRSLQKLLDDDEDALRLAKQAATKISNEVNREAKRLQGVTDPKRNPVNVAIEQAANVGRSSGSFVERYIEKGTTEDLERLAMDVRLRLTNGDMKVKTVNINGRDVPIEKAINDGIATLMLDGLMQRGGVMTVGGDKEAREVFTSPDQLFKIMSRDESYGQIETILGPEHASFLRDLSQYFMMKSRAPMGEYDQSIKNLVNDFGVNKLISRAFNIRRGMVSPQYVAAEMSVALATAAGIDIMKLAAVDKDSAKFMSQFLQYPENMTKAEIAVGSNLITNFVITEFANLGLTVENYLGMIDEDLLAEATDDVLEALKVKEPEGES
jgi:hypothetical protein|tara:strand:- start:1108 stop:6126 length:5019 start_codon:yes stop_codon:yes gene_type:complete